MSDPRLKLLEAIAHKKIVAASYNGATIRLAPHLLFQRHGDLFLSALNLSKNWRSEAEKQLGQFKLAGLATLELIDENFTPLSSYEAQPPRPDDVLVLGV